MTDKAHDRLRLSQTPVSQASFSDRPFSMIPPHDGSPTEVAFEAALREVRNDPSDDAAWARLEMACEPCGRPHDVARAYLRMLSPRLAREVCDRLSRRAVAFHEAWLADDADGMVALLARVLEADSEADWAFEQLTTVLTMAQRWDELLTAYDNRLQRESPGQRRAALLRDAVAAVKDFAERPAAAVPYLCELVADHVASAVLVDSLVQALQREEDWASVVKIWQAQLDADAVNEPVEVALRIAEAYMVRLRDPEQCLSQLRVALDIAPGNDRACDVASRLMLDADTPPSLRYEVLDLLRLHHEAAHRQRSVPDVIESVLSMFNEEEQVPLLRELADRLVSLGFGVRAMKPLSTLLMRHPDDAMTRDRLTRLAHAEKAYAALAEALSGAGDRAEDDTLKAELWLGSLEVQRQHLGDQEAAVALGWRALNIEGLPPSTMLTIARTMDSLLENSRDSSLHLEVLDRLAPVETTSTERRRAYASIARLAVRAGDAERGLNAWQAWLRETPDDLAALNAAIQLADSLGDAQTEVQLRLARAGNGASLGQRRTDLVRVAHLLATELNETSAAIDGWLEIHAEYGLDDDVFNALDGLLSQSGRHQELAKILQKSVEAAHSSALSQMCRLAEVQAVNLQDDAAAVKGYELALKHNPRSESARRGLEKLMAEGKRVAEVAVVLAEACKRTGEWETRIELLKTQSDALEDREMRAALLFEAAQLSVAHRQDGILGFSLICRAVVLRPESEEYERELLRLAAETDQRTQAAEMLGEAAVVEGLGPERAADLRVKEGGLWARAGRAEQAVLAYKAALERLPEHGPALYGLCRSGAVACQFDVAVKCAVELSLSKGQLDRDSFEYLERAAGGHAKGFEQLAVGLEDTLQGCESLPDQLGCEFEMRLAHWYLEHSEDARRAGHAAKRAVKHAPTRMDALELLADTQRSLRSPDLLPTLVALQRLGSDSHEVALEAAELAVELGLDRDARREALWTLYRVAVARSTAEDMSDTASPIASSIAWAVDQLTPLEVESGRPHQAAALLREVAAFAFGEAETRAWRLRAAHILEGAGELSDALQAGLCLRDEETGNLELTVWLCSLCERLNRPAQLIELRQQELALTQDSERRMAIRLKLASLMGELEHADGRLHVLRENLTQLPGHSESLEAARQLLSGAHRYDELVGLLSNQAGLLGKRGHEETATELWREAASLAEVKLGNVRRAGLALERAAGLRASAETFDELVRLARTLGDLPLAAQWIEQRLSVTSTADRSRVQLELARTQLAAEQRRGAIKTLLSAFEEQPRSEEVLSLLSEQLREQRDEQALADILAKAAHNCEDGTRAVELGLESGRLYARSEENSQQLVDVTERALSFAPGDHELRTLFAQGLAGVGRLEQARDELQRLLEESERGRAVTRAGLHAQLSRVLRLMGEVQLACGQLELASGLQPRDACLLSDFAEVAIEVQDLERAERALRSLLSLVRHGPVKLQDDTELGAGEVWLRLSELASQAGDTEKAKTLEESGFESLAAEPKSFLRVQKTLKAQGNNKLLERILHSHLKHESAPHHRANKLVELAEVVSEDGTRRDEALELLWTALRLDPGAPDLHDTVAEVVHGLGCAAQLMRVLEEMLSESKGASRNFVRCELALRLGDFHLRREEFSKARARYRLAEETGVREGDVWRALLKLASARGDEKAQADLLVELSRLGEAELDRDGRGDVNYRLAEIRLAGAETREEGVALLRAAWEGDPQPRRAAMLLVRCLSGEPHEELGKLYSEVVQGCTDEDVKHVGSEITTLEEGTRLTTLMEPLSRGRAAPVRCRLLALQAEAFLMDSSTVEQGSHLLRRAFDEAASDPALERALLKHCGEMNGRREAAACVQQRLTEAYAVGDTERCADLALALNHMCTRDEQEWAFSGLRAALELAPGDPRVSRALLDHISAEQEPLERAALLGSVLAAEQVERAGDLALEAGGLFQQLGEEAAALRALELGYSHAPTDSRLWQPLVRSYRSVGDFASLARVLVEMASFEKHLTQKASLLREVAELRRRKLDDLPGAATVLTEVVQAVPDDWRGRVELAEVLILQRSLDAAGIQLQKAVEHSGEDQEAKARVARARASLTRAGGEGQSDAAIRASAHSIPANVNHVDPAQSEGGQEAVAEDQTVELQEEVQQKGGEVTKVEGRPGETAESAAPKAAERNVDERAMQHALEAMYEDAGRSSDDRREREALIRLLDYYDAHEDWQESCDHMRSWVERRPEDEEIEQRLRRAYERSGQSRKLAHLLLGRARQTSDGRAKAVLLREAAEQLLASGATGEACRVLQRIHRAYPADIATTRSLAKALNENGQAVAAREALEEALAKQPKSNGSVRSVLFFDLGRLAQGGDDVDRAVELLRQAWRTDRNNHEALVALADLAEASQRWEAAGQALTAVLACKDKELIPYAEALVRRARVAFNHGSPAQAMRWVKKALEAEPENDELKEMMAAITNGERRVARGA